jgi:hypothetical protein
LAYSLSPLLITSGHACCQVKKPLASIRALSLRFNLNRARFNVRHASKFVQRTISVVWPGVRGHRIFWRSWATLLHRCRPSTPRQRSLHHVKARRGSSSDLPAQSRSMTLVITLLATRHCLALLLADAGRPLGPGGSDSTRCAKALLVSSYVLA